MRNALLAVVAVLVGGGACTSVAGLNDLSFTSNAPTGAGGRGGEGAQGGSGAQAGGGGLSSGGSGGCASDLTTDPDHCGACGRSCLGGACVEGVCEPVVLTDGLNAPLGVLVVGETVFVAEADTGGHVWRLELASRELSIVAENLNRPTYLAAGTGKLYVTEHNEGRILQMNPDGSASTTIVQGATVSFPYGVEVKQESTAERIYWVNGGNNGDVLTRTLPAGTDSYIGGPWTLPEGTALDDNFLWVAVEGEQAIYRISLKGGATPERYWSGEADPVDVAVDDSYVYFSDQDGGSIRRLPKLEVPYDGPAEVMVAGLNVTGGLDVTVDAIYFASLGSGELFRLAK